MIPANRSLISSEDGSVTFASVVVVLGLAVLLAFSGNVCSEALRKQRLQNAADSIAYSTAVWAARGMNTVSIVNHALGELTAFCVILDALGGWHAEQGVKFEFENVGMDYYRRINNRKQSNYSGCSSESSYGKTIDQSALTVFSGIFASFYREGRDNNCSAAIYDARIVLLFYADMLFEIKKTATMTLEKAGQALIATGILAWLGYILEGVGTAINLTATTILMSVAIEMPLLKMLDETTGPISNTMQNGVYGAIPLLCAFSNQMSGFPSSYLGSAIDQMCRELRNTYQLKALSVAPSIKEFRLPLIPESMVSPSINPNIRIPYCPWGGNDFQETAVSELSKILGFMETINDAISFVSWGLKLIYGDKIPGSVSLPSNKGDGVSPGDGVYSTNPAYSELHTFDVNSEQVSQWVRSTCPPLDSMRLPFREAFTGLVPISNLSTFFVRWSYIYALEKSHLIRSGQKTSGKRPAMLVLKDFDASRKGNEPWTQNASKADQMFAVIVAVQDKGQKAIFTDSTFKRSNEQGDVAIAQAMFYNANGRDTNTQGNLNSKPGIQPLTGWDTLQWKWSIQAREWNSPPDPNSMRGGGFFNATNFNIGGVQNAYRQLVERRTMNEKAHIQLNWQAKLTPVSKQALQRLKKTESSQKNDQIQNACDLMIKYDGIISH